MNTTMRSNNGLVTAYGFACGDIEMYPQRNVHIGREHGVYHVKGINNGKRIYETFRLVSSARKFVRSLNKEI